VPQKSILWPVKLKTFLYFRTMNWTRLLWAMVHASQLATITRRKVTRAVHYRVEYMFSLRKHKNSVEDDLSVNITLRLRTKRSSLPRRGSSILLTEVWGCGWTSCLPRRRSSIPFAELWSCGWSGSLPLRGSPIPLTELWGRELSDPLLRKGRPGRSELWGSGFSRSLRRRRPVR
jgi:hypothetical protein